MDGTQTKYGIRHTQTNENLYAIIAGMQPRLEDRILSVCSSGDQPFALLEQAAVIAIDKNPAHIDYMKERVQMLLKKDYEKFSQARNSFWNFERLEKIRKRLGSLTIAEGDIIEAAMEGIANKVYFSNVTLDTKALDSIGILSATFRSMPGNSPVYVSNHDDVSLWSGLDKDDDFAFPDFMLDRKLTEKARQLEPGLWFPGVYVKRA